MSRLTIILASLLILAGCSGQAMVNALTPTWGYQLHANIAYGNLPRQKLDIYVPDDVSEPAPVVVFFYGGRWENGNKEGYKFMAQALTSIGAVAVIPNYRLYPQVEFPAFVQDAAAVVAWVHAHISAYGGNPNWLFVMGHSAGAYLAAMITLDPEYLQAVGGSPNWLAGMIGLAGPYDFLPLKSKDLQDMFGPPRQYPQTQPINFVSGKNPPMLLMAGADDTTVLPKNSRHLAAAISAAGGPVTLKIYPGVDHIGIIAPFAFILRFTGDQLLDVQQFIQQVVAGLNSGGARQLESQAAP